MKKANVIFLVLLFSSNFILFIDNNENVSAKDNASLNTVGSYDTIITNTKSTFEINILSDQNLTDYGFPGIGTLEDPYRIENYRIYTSKHTAINIYNTTKYITIQNCTIKASHTGLYVSHVGSGTVKIQNNTIHETDLGFWLSNCDEIVVRNNTFEYNAESFHIDDTIGIDISFNIFRYNDYGIRTYPTLIINHFTNIMNNYFYKNDNGIYCLTNLKDFNIHNNSFLNNELGLAVTGHSEINVINGIYSNITYNLVENSTVHGIRIIGCIETLIHHNTFANNNLNGEGTSQASHNILYEKVFWYDKNTKKGNYWSDWNGIFAYKIEGDANAKDYHPLNKPVHEVKTEIPAFFIGRVIINSTVIPIAVIILGVIIYIYFKRRRANQ